MTAPSPLAVGSELLFREAALIDRQDWDAWLALYVPDCVFWVPTWTGDHTLARDPETELSHIYYATRSGLEDRVWRIRSGLSIASLPMPRTMHALTNVRLVEASDAVLDLEANFSVDVVNLRNRATHRLFGRYAHRLAMREGAWRIARKVVTVLNDDLPSVVDVYSV
ncbi:MAG TPA: aromatic-ring-hydroxylating dioxygenase subunit beta [Candidatus Sulfotelmatobacter sp.]|nr:aromatic-ring-hydroxylating dioxygenase subunit beta [Candidatus Sulfotelmatobacter sp.]